MERIRETVEGSGGALVVFFIPPRWEIYPGELRRSELPMANSIDGAAVQRQSSLSVWFQAKPSLPTEGDHPVDQRSSC